MVQLPKVTDLNIKDRKVLVRADLDVGETLEEGDDRKLLTNKQTIDYLIENGASVVLISHRGRPGGSIDDNLSLIPVANRLSELIRKEIKTTSAFSGEKVFEEVESLLQGEILMLENLRFDPREELNDNEFSNELSRLGDVFINEAFSSSAKEHSSIVGITKYLPGGLGFHFLNEIENLTRAFENPQRPVVVCISGLKQDKLDKVEAFGKFADKILIAGRLPIFIDPRGVGKSDLPSEFREKILKLIKEGRVLVADLIQDKEDITLNSIEKFEKEIFKSKTIVVSGPVGKYEDDGHALGTKRVFEAIAKSDAFKIAGGGDTEQAIDKFGITKKFNWISVGGGATLEYLSQGTLPGIEALLN